MKLLNFSIIKLTVFLIVGIVMGSFILIDLNISIATSSVLLTLLSILLFVSKKQFTQSIWFGSIAFLTMVSIGILTVNLHNEKNFTNHYLHNLDSKKDTIQTITFRIREVLKPGYYSDKYIIDVFEMGNNKISGKSLLNIKKDSTSHSLHVDEIYVVKTEFKDLNPPLNPGQFDYKNYLEKKYIYHQLFVDNASIFKTNSKKTTIFGIANSIRDHINSKLKKYDFKPDELAIINALLLGQRQDISEDVYDSYTNAGAIHILAVSGLHVGIVLLILTIVFKPLEKLKHGRLIKTIVLVSFLWSFAVIAGLSASVTRAVTMFSIVAIGMNLKRPTNIYNTLAISILVLLLFKPMFLFDVGFQLSYLAVFAIVIIDPILYKLWRPKNWLLDKYWHTLTITIAAQFGIIPISLFYFHQFPGLFFISNLVIIPLLGMILGLGILVILLAVLNILPNVLASIFGSIIGYMNDFVGWVSHQESFLFKDIPFSFLYVLVFYTLIISFFKVFFRRNYRNLRWFLVAIIVVQCAVIYTNYSKPNKQFIVFHKSRYSLIGNTINNTIVTASDFDSITASKNNIVRNYQVLNNIEGVEKESIKPVYILNNKKLLIVDSLGLYNLKQFNPNYVLLRQSPKINLNRLIDSIQPKQIIADGSNYKSYVENWSAICAKRKLPFHQTGKKGAFIIEY
ncbi:ComEC/Rec2 family competence protein [Algibacter sp. 2305UL17-15]|uniref:ComEC/Rec2 family competence protein n=1 Tax=Algibacter sp. 2305UL17-15 TaxID=3231268 RepID=UPI00345756B4